MRFLVDSSAGQQKSRIGYVETDTMSSKFANLDPTRETE